VCQDRLYDVASEAIWSAGGSPAFLFHHRKIKKFKKILKNAKELQVQQLAYLFFENLYGVAASTDKTACGLKSGATVPVVMFRVQGTGCRFKKWRNRPGCDGQNCRGMRSAEGACLLSTSSIVSSLPPVPCPLSPAPSFCHACARTLSWVGCPLGGWGWMISEPRRKHSAAKAEFQEKS
jgi:hypothetical protein